MIKRDDYQQKNNNQGNFQNHGPKVHHNHNVNRSAERNINHSPERGSVERSTDHNIERNVDRSTGRSPERTVEHNTNHGSMDRSVERSVDRGPERSANRSTYRDNRQFRSYSREAPTRHSYSGQSSVAKYNVRYKAEESVEDIKADITRIEKEIELEIREIKSMRLGL